MKDLAGRIEELEVEAAESALIADLSTDWGVRTYNTRLASDLREAAASLRAVQTPWVGHILDA